MRDPDAQCTEMRRSNWTGRNQSKKTGRGHKPGDQMQYSTKTEE